MTITSKSRLAELVEAEIAKENAPGFTKSVWIKTSNKWDLWKDAKSQPETMVEGDYNDLLVSNPK